MKHRISAILLTLTFAVPSVAQAQDTAKKTPTIQEINQQFSNLPKKKRDEYWTKLLKVKNLFNQKRIFDSLEKIDELNKIFPDHPAALNIQGACYVEIRAFDKANEIFTRVLSVDPKNTHVLFNLAEVDFVTKNWKSAEERFSKIIPLAPSKNIALIRLCEFKLLLCKLKLGKEQEAIALKDKYDYWDDSPFYYFSRAAIAYHKEEKEEAAKLISNARYVWKNDNILAAWQDTLIEYGYVRSFYGGDMDEEQGE